MGGFAHCIKSAAPNNEPMIYGKNQIISVMYVVCGTPKSSKVL